RQGLRHQQFRLSGQPDEARKGSHGTRGSSMGWVMVLMPLTLLVMGVPIFFLLLATCITAVTFFSKLPHPIVHQVMFDSVSKFPLIAVPFFIFTGDLMSNGGLSTRLLRWVASMVG